jgi:hypothetical protein
MTTMGVEFDIPNSSLNPKTGRCFYRRSQRKPTANFFFVKIRVIRGQLFLFIQIPGIALRSLPLVEMTRGGGMAKWLDGWIAGWRDGETDLILFS